MTEAFRRGIIWRKLAGLRIQPSTQTMPTGLAALDAVLGPGGLPRGRIVEWFGPPSCGKTTLALQTVGFLQRSGCGPAWIDADRSFDPLYAAALGVTLDRLPVLRPETAEEALEMAGQLVHSAAVDLLVVDSAAALIPRLELAAGIGDGGPGLHDRVLASGLRKLGMALRRRQATALFLNQSRAQSDLTGEMETSAGGPALKLRAGVRIAFQPEGGRLRLRVLKNPAVGAFAVRVLDPRHPHGFGGAPETPRGGPREPSGCAETP